jgi:hypothetical protein
VGISRTWAECRMVLHPVPRVILDGSFGVRELRTLIPPLMFSVRTALWSPTFTAGASLHRSVSPSRQFQQSRVPMRLVQRLSFGERPPLSLPCQPHSQSTTCWSAGRIVSPTLLRPTVHQGVRGSSLRWTQQIAEAPAIKGIAGIPYILPAGVLVSDHGNRVPASVSEKRKGRTPLVPPRWNSDERRSPAH